MFVSNDRCNNSFNLDRAVIKDSLIYIRNFTPFSPEQRWIHYFIMGEICQIMHQDYIEGKLSEEQSLVFNRRSPECLYNLDDDNWEMNNLIDDPQYSDQAAEMRNALEQHILESQDVLFANEYDLKRISANTTPYAFRTSNDYNIEEIWEAASLSGFSNSESKQKQINLLEHHNKLVRFWAAVGLKSQTNLDSDDLNTISTHLQDSYPPVQIYLASVLYDHTKDQDAETIIKDYSLSSDPDLSLMALHNIQNMTNNMDFADFIPEVYLNVKGVKGLWPTRASAEVLLYRLKGIKKGQLKK
jgi:hypothetical protein